MATSLCINNGKRMRLILRLKFNLSQFKVMLFCASSRKETVSLHGKMLSKKSDSF